MDRFEVISFWLAVVMFLSAIVNGFAGRYDAAGIDMIACAIFWTVAR